MITKKLMSFLLLSSLYVSFTQSGVGPGMFDDLPKIVGTLVVGGAVVTGGTGYVLGYLRGKKVATNNFLKNLQKLGNQQLYNHQQEVQRMINESKRASKPLNQQFKSK